MNCKEEPKLQDPVRDPARLKWHEVKKVDHYYLTIDALTQRMEIKEESPFYLEQKNKENSK
jgi:hypothetical protein